MKIPKYLTLLSALLLMGVCAYGQDIHYNYDRATNFAAYKTYQWVDLSGGVVADQLVDQAIKRAIDEQLAQKGLTKVEKDADLCVGYQAGINLEKSFNLWGMRDRVGGWGGFDTASVQGQTSTIPFGTLVLSVYDAGRKQLVWRGDASNSLDLKKDPDKNYKNLQKAMAKLLKNYPPQPIK